MRARITVRFGVRVGVRVCDRGSGTVLAVSIIGAVAALTMIAVPSSLGLAARQSLVGAADAAALAAADTVSGAVAGDPCDRAAQVAIANGGRLAACEIDGYVVTVAVSRTIIGIRALAAATAGPPESAG